MTGRNLNLINLNKHEFLNFQNGNNTKSQGRSLDRAR